MKKNIYLISAVLGAIIPWGILISRFSAQEPIANLFGFLFVNAYSASFTADLTFAIIAFIFFVMHETQRQKMKNAWLYILVTFIGLSFALPLFLYFREQKLEQLKTDSQ